MTSKLVLNHCIKKSDKGKLREEKIWMILFVIYQESWFRWIISDTLTRHPSAWTAQETGYMRLALSTSVQLSSVQSLIHVRLFATPWTAALQASLSITNSRSPPKLMSTESEMPSNHLVLCRPLLLQPSIFPSIRVFSNESALHIMWPNIGVLASKSVFPMNTQDWSPLGWTGWISLQSKGLSRVFSNTTVQKHQFFGAQLSLQSNSHIHTWPQEKP